MHLTVVVLCGSRKYPYPSHGRFFGLLPPGISMLREHDFCCNVIITSIFNRQYTIHMFAIQFEMFYVVYENFFKRSQYSNVLTLLP